MARVPATAGRRTVGAGRAPDGLDKPAVGRRRSLGSEREVRGPDVARGDRRKARSERTHGVAGFLRQPTAGFAWHPDGDTDARPL